MVDRGRRHARQDHHHQPGRRGAGSGAARSHRDQRRHHQRLRHQHAAGRRRLDGGGGRRKRRQLPAPARGHRRRHQHGPGASGPLGHAGGDDRRLRPVRRQRAVLRLCGAVHRPSGGAADDPAPVGSSHHHLRVLAAGRCARRTGGARQAGLAPSKSSSPTGCATGSAAWGRFGCRCWASTTCRTRWRRSRSALEMEIDDATLRSAFAQLQGRQAPLHQDRRGRRYHRDRRLRPPSGGDRRGAEGRASGRRARRDRGGAAASLHAAAFAVR